MVSRRARSPSVEVPPKNLLKRRRILKKSPDVLGIYSDGTSLAFQARGSDASEMAETDALLGAMAADDGWLDGTQGMNEEAPLNSTPGRNDPIPQMGMSQRLAASPSYSPTQPAPKGADPEWWKDPHRTQEYNPFTGSPPSTYSQGASSSPAAYETPAKSRRVGDSQTELESCTTKSNNDGLELVPHPMDLDEEDDDKEKDLQLPIQLGREKWVPEGKARKMLFNWAYKEFAAVNRGRQCGKSAKTKQKARNWLLTQRAGKLQALLNDTMEDADVYQYRIGCPSARQLAKDKPWDGRSRFILLTFNQQTWQVNPPIREVRPTIRDIEEWARTGCPMITCLWNRAQEEIEGLVRRMEVIRWTMSLEICPKTYKEKNVVKFHFHVVLEWSRRIRFVKLCNKIVFCGARVGHVTTDGTDQLAEVSRKRARKLCSDSMHFYGQIQKVGFVFQKTNFVAFQDFNVNPRWISTWFQRQKITYDVATKLFIDCGSNVRGNLCNMEEQRKALNTMAMKAHQAMVLNSLAATQKKCLDLGGQIGEWENQFLELKERYKFLVLNGKGGTGKTKWACAYFARHARTPDEYIFLRKKMLFLTCTGTELPNVGRYTYGEHYGIVYDEGTPEMVWSNREVFQGLPEISTIGDSHTHRFAQDVCLSGCRQIITCNDWNDRMSFLTKTQQEWFAGNAIVIQITDPVYTDVSLYSPVLADGPPPEIHW